MDGFARHVSAKAGEMADVSADLVSALYEAGADVHVALPHYRRLFSTGTPRQGSDPRDRLRRAADAARVHLAEDRIFYYRTAVYGNGGSDTADFALVFQREVINQILPRVQPDVVHCHDWTTGLIPAFTRRLGIPCLFTMHSTHTYEMPLARVEQCGIDAAQFWQYLYFTRQPHSYQESRQGTLVEPLASAVFAAQYVNTVSPTFLHEIVDGAHDSVPAAVRAAVRNKCRAGCAAGILNAPPRSYDPRTDSLLPARYSAETQHVAKRENKRAFQEELGLEISPAAPLLLWPFRLDSIHGGGELLRRILREVMPAYWGDGLQLAILADGPAQSQLYALCNSQHMPRRIGVARSTERLSHLGYAAADFVLAPSGIEPGGLPAVIGSRYGALAVVGDTGAFHDAVTPMDVHGERGNGFPFAPHTPRGLCEAIDHAMAFYRLPAMRRRRQVARVMLEAQPGTGRSAASERYIRLYEQLAGRPLVNRPGGRDAATCPECEVTPARGTARTAAGIGPVTRHLTGRQAPAAEPWAATARPGTAAAVDGGRRRARRTPESLAAGPGTRRRNGPERRRRQAPPGKEAENHRLPVRR
jgi:starch synthase